MPFPVATPRRLNSRPMIGGRFGVVLLFFGFLLLPTPAVLAADIWTVNTSGSGLMPITGAYSGSVERAVVSPDGTKIAFDDGADIYLMDVDGSNVNQLTQSEEEDASSVEPSFAANGTKIIFTRYGDDEAELHRMNIDGSGRTHLLDITFDDQEFAFSPNGSKIAFTRWYDGFLRIYVMNSDGSEVARLTSDEGWGDRTPVFSPSGSTIAFTRSFTPGFGQSGMWLMDADGSDQRPVPNTDGSDSYPVFSPDGNRFAFVDGEGAISLMNVGGSNRTRLTDAGIASGFPRFSPSGTKVLFIGQDWDDYLLERYRPQLRYHFVESYRADSASTATLPLASFSDTDPNRSNNLERENGAILAAANPLLGYPGLGLYGLPARAHPGGDFYDSGEPALGSDRIDFRNDTYQADAATMHEDPWLADKIYARATHDEDGKVWLQYWLFYYYSDVPFPLIGDHEADWEMIQVGLDSNLTPDVATYAQHAGAESCSWDRVPKYNGPLGIAPVVFVGLGSHASEFYPSVVESYAAESGSERVRPEIEQKIGNSDAGWAEWRGRWGGSDSLIRSPGEQGAKWDAPKAFNGAAGPCPAQATGAISARHGPVPRPRLRLAQKPKLPGPQLSARRVGRRALVRYKYPRGQWRRLPRRTGLVLAIRGSEKGSLPRNVIFRLRNRTGKRRLALPRSPGPYVVVGQTLVASGGQSRPVTIRLR
jgi:Tol biopolymer transport system component